MTSTTAASSSSSSSSSKSREQLASFVSGICARAIEYPFDTIKTKMQTMMKRRQARQQKQQQQQQRAPTSSSFISRIPPSSNTTPLNFFLRQRFQEAKSSMKSCCGKKCEALEKRVIMRANLLAEIPKSPKQTTTASRVSSSSSSQFFFSATNKTKNLTMMRQNSYHYYYYCSALSPKSSSSSAFTTTKSTSSFSQQHRFIIKKVKKTSPSFQTANRIIKKDGLRGLYRGSSGPFLASAAEMTAAFTGYNRTLDAFSYADGLFSSSSSPRAASSSQSPSTPSMFRICVAGGVAGVLTATVLTPFELIKCKMQTTNRYKSSFDCLKKVLRNSPGGSSSSSSSLFKNYRQGLRALYTGHRATLAREIPGNAAWFGAYEFSLRTLFANNNNNNKNSWNSCSTPYPWYATPIAGSISGIFYVTIFYPADVVKTLIQTDRSYSKLTLLQGLRRVYRQGGVRALYFGLTISAARAIPSNAVIFSVYENLAGGSG